MSIFELPDGRVIEYELADQLGEPGDQDEEEEDYLYDAPIVVLSNPLCCHFEVWDRFTDLLLHVGFRVLRHNQPGHGDSGVPDDLTSTTFDTMADDMHALLAHMGIESLHAWIGVSMGASLAIYFAAKYPGIVDKLVPCDTISCAPVLIGEPDPFPGRVAAMRTAGSMDDLINSSLHRWFTDEWMAANANGEVARMWDLMSTTTMDGYETCCAALSNPSYDLRHRVVDAGRGCKSALVVAGENDVNLLISMEELREGLQEGTGLSRHVDYHIIHDAGHVVFVDGFDDFCDVVVPYLLH